MGISYLGLFAVSLLAARLANANSLELHFRLKKVDIYLLCFLFLVFIKTAVEHPDNSRLFAYSLGSDSGILFYLLVGLLLGLNPLYSSNNLSANIYIYGKRSAFNSFINVANIVPSIAIILSSLYWTYQEFIFFISSLRIDLFLVDTQVLGQDPPYQRMGDYIAVKLIAVILAVVSATFSHIESKKISIAYNLTLLFDLLLTFCALLACIFSFLTSLAIGSNKAALLSIFSLTLIVYACAARHCFRALLISNHITLLLDACLLFKPLKFVKYILVTAAFAAPVISLFAVFSIDQFFKQTRLTAFGDESGALGARIDILLNNTIAQFDVAPLVGNMYADGLSTGPGTYVHSLPVFLLTHTGLLGLLLFYIFMLGYLRLISNSLICIYRNISKSLKSHYKQMRYIVQLIYGQIGLFILIIALSLAIVGTSLFWGFLWFTIGITFGISRFQSDFLKVAFQGGSIS